MPMTSCDHLRQPALQRSSRGITTSICISLLGLPEQNATDRVAETTVLDPRSRGQGAGRVGFLGGGLSPRLIQLTSLHTDLQTASFQRWERASHQHREWVKVQLTLHLLLLAVLQLYHVLQSGALPACVRDASPVCQLLYCSTWHFSKYCKIKDVCFIFCICLTYSFGEGNGDPLQHPCREKPVDGGAWWAAVSGIPQGRTRQKWLSSGSSMYFLCEKY